MSDNVISKSSEACECSAALLYKMQTNLWLCNAISSTDKLSDFETQFECDTEGSQWLRVSRKLQLSRKAFPKSEVIERRVLLLVFFSFKDIVCLVPRLWGFSLDDNWCNFEIITFVVPVIVLASIPMGSLIRLLCISVTAAVVVCLAKIRSLMWILKCIIIVLLNRIS